ncbi:MAG TPA: family 43 glycosylhydrolase [Bacteroidales bacterium]|nr:family 43 glycosylhydrolase [Bacteroidales bacterium]HPR73454.1 family 43 glycosylhydrolase [Bacteroidales bacterium]
MIKLSFKVALPLVLALFIISGISCTQTVEKAEDFTVRITDKPLTFCNPINLHVGSERARRAGEPVVVLYQDDYYLFITGGRGYWFSDNLRDWTYVTAPNFPGGVLSVAINNETLYACSMNQKDVYKCVGDPKEGNWEQTGTFDSDRYGDANMFFDDDGRLYMYYGWSQIMPIKVVELDPNTFKEIGESKVCFFGDYKEHGFERRRAEDVIFPYFDHREYFPEEYPWIEGPWVTKHNGKYYLQYAAIGLEFLSYSHGVYVSDNPMGPFEYSQHNPLTFKTTGFSPGAGHGSTFHDKNGQLWTICMIPSNYGSGRGGSEMALFPTDVDADGVMHSNTAFGDYPQYYPGIKDNAVDNNFTGWMLLSLKKYVEVSSTLEGYKPANAVDEDFMTHWSAETGDPGEYMTVDLGKECDLYALQVNFDQQDAKIEMGRGFGFGGGSSLDRFQSYTVQVSNDNQNWSMLIDKSNVTQDLRHDYIELPEPVKARYVKITNVFTHDEGKFAVKDLRIFGNPDVAKFTKVSNVKIVRNPEDRRDATLLWDPVPGADGYVVRYGIEPGKLYNNYMVYDANTITIHSLNKDPEYHFEVEAFDSGTDYYREVTEETMGRGAEIELTKGRGRGMMGFGQEAGSMVRKMTYEGINEYVFDDITPDFYTLRHTFGPVLWSGELTAAELTGSGNEPTVTAKLSELGKGTEVMGQMNLKVVPGEGSGKIIVTFDYNK